MNTIQRTNLTRVFESNGVLLPDPDPALAVEAAVRLIAMAGRPELANCEIRGPETRGNDLVYTLHRAVGTKGAQRGSDAARPLPPKVRKVIEQLQMLAPTAHAALARPAASALGLLASNKGANGLALPSRSVPWLG